jgi:hypothetical protein
MLNQDREKPKDYVLSSNEAHTIRSLLKRLLILLVFIEVFANGQVKDWMKNIFTVKTASLELIKIFIVQLK